jgi:hypothetical protein
VWPSQYPPLLTSPPEIESDSESELKQTSGNDSHRRKNLHVFFGTRVIDEKKIPCKSDALDFQLSKTWRRSHRKISIAAELTRTVRGGLRSLKLPALQDKIDAASSDNNHPDFLSDGESSTRYMPGHLPERASRRSSSCGPFVGRSSFSSLHTFEPPPPPNSSPKKPYRVRFQEF